MTRVLASRVLQSTRNDGLLLRWQTALPLVERVAALAPSRRAAIEKAWTARVRGLVEAERPSLDVFEAAFGIVSVGCTLPGANGYRNGRKGSKAECARTGSLSPNPGLSCSAVRSDWSSVLGL